MYTVYSDGAYSSSIDQGGIGFVILKDNMKICTFSKMFTHTTNQRMEMLAMTIALESIKNPSEVTVVTDSMYLVGTLTKNWKKKANLDLWERLSKAVDKHIKVDVCWVKGHAKNEYNNEADKLAFEASKQLNK